MPRAMLDYLYSTCVDHSVHSHHGKNDVGRSRALSDPKFPCRYIICFPPRPLTATTTYSRPHRPRFKRPIYNEPPLAATFRNAATADISTPARASTTTTTTGVLPKSTSDSIPTTAAATAGVLSASCYHIATQHFLQPTATTCVCACGTSDSSTGSPKSHISHAAACLCKFAAAAFAESQCACFTFATG
jgi:hypothetical protein